MRLRSLAFLAVSTIAIASSSTLLLPLIRHNGLARGQDALLHVGNVVECSYLLREGSLPPLDWIPDVAGGRGGPNYIYYGTLGFLGPACLVNLGFEPEDAIRVWTGVVFAVGFISAALFTSTLGGWLGGLCGGALFVFGPYNFSLPYSRAAYPEQFAYSLYPLAFYFATRALGKKTYSALMGCSIVVFLIVATHTLSLAILVPFLVVYFLLAGKIVGGRGASFKCMAMLTLSAILLAPSLVGPLFQRQEVVLSEQLRSPQGASFYASFGVPWYSMLQEDFLDDIVSRCVPGRVHLLAALGALLAAAATTDVVTRRLTFLYLTLAFGALVLVERTIAGLCVEALPGTAYLQFPWRFLAVFNLFTAVSLAVCVSKSSPLPEAVKILVALAIPALCVLVYFRHIPSQEVRGLQTRNREGIRQSMTTLDHENKYMPVGAKTFEKPAPQILLEVPDGECYETGSRPNDYSFRVLSRSAQHATFHQYFFDGWRAEIDGNRHPVLKDPRGLCQMDLPPGVQDVRVRFVRTPLHVAAVVISLMGWIALAAVACLAATTRLLRFWRGCEQHSP